jgi:regulator of protease activity HflC (stomatin/prohibitin superfamily)
MLIVILLVAGFRSFTTVETGHRGLRFDPHGGLKRDILSEGRWQLGWFCAFRACSKIIDFDVTFSTKHEEIHATSSENLNMKLDVSVIYKPVISELYELATEVSTGDYYDEVVGPEFRSAAGIVFAKHSYTELAANKEKIEDEIETDLRRRIKGKHVAITSITIESIGGVEEIQNATRARIVGEQESLRQRSAMEQDALRQKTQLENETARKQAEIANRAAEEELRLKTELEAKKNERLIAEEDAQLEKAKATATLAKAHADAEAITILARAHADENRAATQAISPLSVQMEAYKALGQLGGSGTTIMLGDFSHLPAWLFPPGFNPLATALGPVARKP